MNKNKRLTSILLTACLFTVVSNLAAAGNQVVTARQVNNVQEMHAQSIKQGVKVGKLTPKEAKKLRSEQYEISALERKMRSNGSLSAEELAILFKRLEDARNNINKLLRNSISTYGELESDSTKAGRTSSDDASF